ncbi:hypothetical protein BC936DRAFT_139224 [Jimgerdemannia flammicorona]|uniref:Ketoreductase (KR) domain-containing protein n=1 Tax=Jimgerdemannia flammicorona TaxID=994334 RepID=A0A433BAE1_9FUNG|nr:hypothetical protein BC936DRAFT_139224 [Jimgerdemannia flammicorona]
MDLNVLASLLPPITAVVLYFYFSYKRNSVQDGLPSYPSSRFDSHTSSQRPERDRLYNFYRWLSGVTIVPSGVRARIIGFTEALYNISHIKWRTSQSPEEKIGKLVDEHLQARATKGQEEKRPFAIVTGGNAGLGYEIARVLLMADHHVILACRSERAAQSAVTRLQAVTSSDKIEFMQLDLTSFTSARAFSHKVGERVSKAGGEVGVLIRE